MRKWVWYFPKSVAVWHLYSSMFAANLMSWKFWQSWDWEKLKNNISVIMQIVLIRCHFWVLAEVCGEGPLGPDRWVPPGVTGSWFKAKLLRLTWQISEYLCHFGEIPVFTHSPPPPPDRPLTGRKCEGEIAKASAFAGWPSLKFTRLKSSMILIFQVFARWLLESFKRRPGRQILSSSDYFSFSGNSCKSSQV